MSSSKSKLKTDIFRDPSVTGRALRLVPGCHALAPYDAEAPVCTVVEDASVRFAGGLPLRDDRAATGGAFLMAFWQHISEAFLQHTSLHTYVLLFDKKRWVPLQKGATQTSRRTTLKASSERQGLQEWKWDGVSPVLTEDALLPPWSAVRLDGKAYGRCLDDLVALMSQRFTPPPGRRIIIDWPGEKCPGIPLVLECASDGTCLPPYHDVSLTNTAGEADMSAQWYATLARSGGMRTPDRSAMAEFECEGGARSDYPPGDVTLRSPDTDYLPLAMLHYALAERVPNNVWLAMGVCNRKDGEFCKRGEEGAEPHTEMYSVRELCRSVSALGKAGQRPLLQAVAPFAAWCVACGNDYVKRRHGITHRVMWAAYQKSPLAVRWSPVPGVQGPGVALIDGASYAAFVRQCYVEKLKGKCPAEAASSWSVAKEAVAKRFKLADAHMPSGEEAQDMFATVSWAFSYACLGPYGWSAVPK